MHMYGKAIDVRIDGLPTYRPELGAWFQSRWYWLVLQRPVRTRIPIACDPGLADEIETTTWQEARSYIQIPPHHRLLQRFIKLITMNCNQFFFIAARSDRSENHIKHGFWEFAGIYDKRSQRGMVGRGGKTVLENQKSFVIVC